MNSAPLISPTADGLRVRRVAAIVAGVAALVWLPAIWGPTSPDEGGFMLVASQWGPGDSLYGNYWVDRPPLLLLIHGAAAELGGLAALRIIGILAVVVTVQLSAALVLRAVRSVQSPPSRRALLAPVVLTGALLSTRLFGAGEVGGELLTAPLLLGGFVALVAAQQATTTRTRTGWALTAGACAAAAPLVKQNAIDVFLVALVLTLAQLRAGERRIGGQVLAWFTVGAITVTVLVLATAHELGTPLSGLWDAVVTFRMRAAEVLSQSATGTQNTRLMLLIACLVVCAAPAVVALLVQFRTPPLHSARPPLELRWAALVVLSWELFAIAGGGSWWLHYLMVLVPGLALAGAAAAVRSGTWRHGLVGGLGLAVISAAVSLPVSVHAAVTTDNDQQVASYVRDHSRIGDTLTVAFGYANIAWDSGLKSPYQQLWSLPVRVNDPHLAQFRQVLRSRIRPTWLVVAGHDLSSWPSGGHRANRILHRKYVLSAQIGRFTVWHRAALPQRVGLRVGPSMAPSR